jgi:predicted DNA-binding transcriptional regulator AlpA
MMTAKNEQTTHRRIVTRKQLLERYAPISYVSIWSWIRAGKFPPGRRLGTGNNATLIWYSDELDAHDANLPVQRPKGSKWKAA